MFWVWLLSLLLASFKRLGGTCIAIVHLFVGNFYISTIRFSVLKRFLLDYQEAFADHYATCFPYSQ